MSDGIERSDEEIIRYYRKIAPYDFFGVWGTELLLRLDLKSATKYMAQEHGWTEESWKKSYRKRDRESVIGEMEDFIQDAIDRCTRHNKFAVASLDYYRSWTWLIKDMDLFSFLIDDRNFPNYGAPMINAVIETYGFQDLLPDEPMRKSAFLNMAQGKKCNELCVRGCGSGRPSAIQKSLIIPNVPAKTVITPKLIS